MLESFLHSRAFFVTLTYNEEHLPEGAQLVPEHLQKYLRALRDRVRPRTVRFFASGEYGEQKGRPHYHVVLFGDLFEHEIRETWPHGFVQVLPLDKGLCQYIAGYTLDKGNRSDERANGREPEFRRMSLRPGIGISEQTIAALANAEIDEDGVCHFGATVNHQFRVDGKLHPMDRNMRRKLKEYHGLEVRETPREEADRKARQKARYWENPERYSHEYSLKQSRRINQRQQWRKKL